jgi:hypothetical protein
MKFEIEIEDKFVRYIVTPVDPAMPKEMVMVEPGETAPEPPPPDYVAIIKGIVMGRVQQNIQIAYEYKTRQEATTVDDMLSKIGG